MFNPTKVLIDAFVGQLTEGYRKTYGGWKANYCEIIAWAGNIALEIISNSNALYHNVEHTILVTLVGQEILRGLHIKRGGVTCEIWLNTIISLLFHDIGYVRGICRDDNEDKRLYSTGHRSQVVQLAEGATDASLAPFHVDRGKLFIEERFGNHSIINSEQIKLNIELTRFPIPKNRARADSFGYPELIRAADLMGQLGDMRYIQKTAALYYEFEEMGANKKFGYNSPHDLVKNYPMFFWNSVYKYIQPAIRYLKVTVEGKTYLASLYANVFAVEHGDVLKSATEVKEPTILRQSLFTRRKGKGKKKRKLKAGEQPPPAEADVGEEVEDVVDD